MGARSSLEGYRVAAGRYGLPVRKRARRAARCWVLALVLMGAALLASCGATGSKSSGSDHKTACAFVAKLDEIANGSHGGIHHAVGPSLRVRWRYSNVPHDPGHT